MAVSLCEMLWIKFLLKEPWQFRGGPLELWCDNKSAISIANNPVQHDRTKHVEIDRFFIKEKLNSGILKLNYVKSEDQLADCLTKGLGLECMRSFVTRWEWLICSAQLEGGIERYSVCGVIK